MILQGEETLVCLKEKKLAMLVLQQITKLLGSQVVVLSMQVESISFEA
jgi:hypothetical protein